MTITKNRYLNLHSSIIGSILLITNWWFVIPINHYLGLIYYLIIGLIYIIIPIILFKDQDIYCHELKYFDSYNNEITDLIPNNIYYLLFYIIIIEFISWLLFEYFEFYCNLTRLIYIIVPYLVIHCYYFILNLPTTAYLNYFIGEEAAYGILKKTFVKSNQIN